jgi:hypothetical protein
MTPLIKDVAKSVSRFINKSWPEDREDLFDILSLAESYFWISGLYQGSTIYATVKNNKGVIVTPHGYSILEGVAVNKRPSVIRDKNSYFHVNGPGPIGKDAIDSCHCRGELSNTVYDLGEFPTLKVLDKNFKISVEPAACETGSVFISGMNDCGNAIYTYCSSGYSNTESDDNCFCGEDDVAEKIESGMDVIEGVDYSLKKKTMYENLTFSQITGITKTQTLAPVNIYAVYEDGTKELISRMEPFQTESIYRLYQIENEDADIVGLFRRSKPSKIKSDTRRFLVDSDIATLTMVEGVYTKHYTEDQQKGAALIADAIAILKESFRSSQSNYKAEIQVSGREFSVRGIRR